MKEKIVKLEEKRKTKKILNLLPLIVVHCVQAILTSEFITLKMGTLNPGHQNLLAVSAN